MTVEARPVDLLFGGRREAITTQRCQWCEGPVGDFRDKVSRREYDLSGHCQACQDGFFEEGP